MWNLQTASTVALVASILNIAMGAAPAQSGQELRFAAASLKPLASAAPVAPPAATAPSGEEIISERVVRTTGENSANPGVLNPGRIHLTATLRELIANAYDVKEFQVDGPVWMDEASFVLDATMPPETTRPQRLSMLQNLLADRFKMRAHLDRKELPMYSLVVAKNGTKVKESAALPEATTVRTVAAAGQVRISAERETMPDLVERLASQLKRPVRDETGLAGRYDFVLTFSSEGPDAQDLPDLFGALQTQLGLKLEVKKGPAQLVVIDSIEKIPVEN